jgi:hypothetical protein
MKKSIKNSVSAIALIFSMAFMVSARPCIASTERLILPVTYGYASYPYEQWSSDQYRLNKFWPSKNIIRAELRDFIYDSKNTSIREAEEMLIYLGAEEISMLTSTYVSGKFGSGAEITIWPNTYDKKSCYGIRYGKPLPGRPYFGSNDTYFEICK